MPSISVFVPSYRRPAELERCVRAVAILDPPPTEIVIGLRPDDEEGTAAVERLAGMSGPPVRMVEVLTPGHLPPLVAGLAACRGDIMAVLDDDAVPRPGWTACIAHWMASDDVVVVGGPVVDHPASRSPSRFVRSDRRTWYRGFARLPQPGGQRAAREVSYLKGGNAAYRRAALALLGFDMRLNRGAAVGYELDVGLGLRRLGRLVFEPQMVVDHYPGERRAAPNRDAFERYAGDYTFNLFYIAAKRFGWGELASFLFYMTLVGQAPSPGLLFLLPVATRQGIPPGRLAAILWRERLAALHQGLRARRTKRRTRT